MRVQVVCLHSWSIPACAGEPVLDAGLPTPVRVYPRVCGGTPASRSTPWRTNGLSPRVRGTPKRTSDMATAWGSIPACAGEPARVSGRLAYPRVYPRVCGGTPGWPPRTGPVRGLSPRVRGTAPPPLTPAQAAGLSPRVRGNPRGPGNATPAMRSIPACAGEPDDYVSSKRQCGVYPRVCGGTHPSCRCTGRACGLSPRVRGNPFCRRGWMAKSGSIPACAGEPRLAAAAIPAASVYPRVCGGTQPASIVCGKVPGLSPRVRGNLPAGYGLRTRRGSIPACAGEPAADYAAACAREVYPRVCGGTTFHATTASQGVGLSPRVRGNLGVPAGVNGGPGSIPACAGEPHRIRIPAWRWGVYPRVCGGTQGPAPALLSVKGLSPRVRGNPAHCTHDSTARWSIPACAGEPSPAAYLAGPARGLSPRVRGNRVPRWGWLAMAGSIPACAGEPLRLTRKSGAPMVYPRVCGGTAISASVGRSINGLSPRVRGNRWGAGANSGASRSIPACAGEPIRVIRGQIRKRSIPACAGEPSRRPALWRVGPVYPRVCGGTLPAQRHRPVQPGLSPRVRGNRTAAYRDLERQRSIPACAGEPAGAACRNSIEAVYPRVCGGTAGANAGDGNDGGLSPRVRGNRGCR